MVSTARTLTDYLDYFISPLNYEWSVQGLGMLRSYVSETERLHVWHSDIRNPDASPIHDHPWSFTSEILWGAITQTRYSYTHHPAKAEWCMQPLHCGEGGGLKGKPILVNLHAGSVERYVAGHTYSQVATEIHNSRPDDGTVSLITRTYHPNRDIAHVFWPRDTEWGSAEPRPATRAEILHITRSVLHKYQET